MIVRCCLTILHWLGHPGKQGNRKTWDGVPATNTTRMEVWVNARDLGMYGKLSTRLRVLGLVSSFCASLIQCVTTQIERNNSFLSVITVIVIYAIDKKYR